MAEAVSKTPGYASKALMSLLRMRLRDKDTACIKGLQRIGTAIDLTHGVPLLYCLQLMRNDRVIDKMHYMSA